MNSTDSGHLHTNRLADETSPYLLQHAHNPVDWYPWGDEALARARHESKLILLSIGYSACHWCHVMERECFENERIAALMNEHCVNVKVDREERPDLDEIYMAATMALNEGQGGWPMTVFLTPELEPVFAGTYFPPEDRWGRPGFRTLLEALAEAWREDPEHLRQGARRLVEQLRRQRASGPPMAVGQEELQRALVQLGQDFDPTWGGFGGAPKFPPATALALLLRLHRRFGNEQALQMASHTLEAMARGGIYDQVGGGFARYATDQRWLVPHFEKMLYDNALLAGVYLEAFQVTRSPLFRRIATETLDYVLREMTAPEGGFYSSTDADSEGEEGKFFVWTPAQVEAVLGAEDARPFNAWFDVSAAGNWEGKSILHVPREPAEVAAQCGLTEAELAARLATARERIYQARQQRVPPGLDDKVLTAWNGLMIRALAIGAQVLGEPRYLAAARRAAQFLLTTLCREDGGLLRTWRAGKAQLPAYLEDYACLVEALVELWEASGEVAWLRRAEQLAERMLAEFRDPDSGAFFHTAEHHQHLLLRYRDGVDGATPSGNAVASHALIRLSYHLDRADLRQTAVAAIQAYGELIRRFPRSFAKTLCAVDLLLDGPVELVLVGTPGSPDLAALEREVACAFLPQRVLARVDPAGEDPGLPLTAGKTLAAGRAALHVCQDQVCQAPITEPLAAAIALAAAMAPPTSDDDDIEPLPGRATAAGTARYAARHGGGPAYGPFGASGWTVSRTGFGAYRADDFTPVNHQALVAALRGGVNLIDTSTNYAEGGSERLVGNVLRELIEGGELARDEVVVVSKIGYVQGENHQLAEERETMGQPYPEMVKLEPELWHCIHPQFLLEQLERSLRRLQLACLDLCLLHNPEYFLVVEARRGTDPEAARDELYRRMGEAFAALEGEVAAGRLSGYGVSSNHVAMPAEHSEATSLERMLAAARRAGGPGHHFRALQLPLNLFEPAGLLAPAAHNSVLAIARQASVAVLTNRPLNSITREGLVRLAEVTAEPDLIAEDDPAMEFRQVDVAALLMDLTDLEQQFRSTLAPRLAAPGGPPPDIFRWASRLAQLPRPLRSLHQWQALEGHLRRQVNHLAEQLEQHFRGAEAETWRTWANAYLPRLEAAMVALRRQATASSCQRNEALHRLLDPLLPAERRSEPLARKALWVVASTPGVGCMLHGMHHPDYVEDALAVLRWPPLENPEAVYQRLLEAQQG